LSFTTFFFAIAISDFTHHYEKESQLKTRKKELRKMENMDFLADLNCGKGVNKHEFVLAILIRKGLLNKEKDVDPWIDVSFLIILDALFHVCLLYQSAF